MVHRDVTPGNVMLTPTGVKVVDFGISALVGESEKGPDGALLGTPAYLAPERLDNGQVSPATDVYAVGLLLYRMLTGRLPWQASTTTQMLRAHMYDDPEPMPAGARAARRGGRAGAALPGQAPRGPAGHRRGGPYPRRGGRHARRPCRSPRRLGQLDPALLGERRDHDPALVGGDRRAAVLGGRTRDRRAGGPAAQGRGRGGRRRAWSR